ncbi:D-alanyl-D-alanine carboxypeptidase family protein [Acinetobacter boissieri]|uniref:D-alanyl-D-alanine carboxypeptidase family protein n=1 Tax=Acinetobacter boissieri TaxID=1219383 RepID=UPI001FCDF89C|nr:D-alanyl-D-alanine carboxypeptidase family protein [Acinetobacter boissieri]
MFSTRPLLAFFLFIFVTSSNAAILNIAPESVEAESWMIFDPQTEQVIAEHNADIQRAPASLTKMMVAYLTLEAIHAGQLKTTDPITASSIVNYVKFDESKMGLKVGERITIDQLLSGLIVMSANDAAVTLAEKISGNLPQFIEKMNTTAQQLGMSNTHFTNPAGITMPDHYSSAADLVKLADHLIKKYPEYLNYSKQQSYTWDDLTHKATNLLLKKDNTIDGLKTGYTAAAGFNLALTAKRLTADSTLPERRLIVVVLGTKSKFKRAQVANQLMNLAFAYTQDIVAIKANQPLFQLPIINGQQKSFTFTYKNNKILTTSLYAQDTPIQLQNFDMTTGVIVENKQPVLPLNPQQIKLNITLDQKQLIAPINREMVLANVTILQNNQPIDKLKISAPVVLERASLFERFMHWIRHILPFMSNKTTEAIIYQ